ncbi:MAG: TonB-dependent receptor, partial [Bacteroidaceae bacterium]
VNPIKRFSTSFSGTYTGSMLVGHSAGSGVDTPIAVNTPHFFDLGVKFSYDLPLFDAFKMKLYAGIKNIFEAYQSDFDKGYNRDSGYIYGPSLPRSYYIGAKMMF